MRLAIACRDVRGVTGTTTTILEHSRRLAALGWDVHVFGERLDPARIRDAGAAPHRLPAWPFASAFKRRLFSWLFDRKLKRERFDLVWGHGDTLTQDVLSLHNCVHAAHQCVHGAPLPANSGVGRMHARMLSEKRFRLLIANSELMKRELAARFRVEESSMAVVHPGHDPARFHPVGRRPGGVLCVGLITSGDFAKRGVPDFIEAVARLRARVRCLVMGQERRLAPYRAQAAQAAIADRIRFLPPDPAVERYFRSLDLYVHPALYVEFGQSVQELGGRVRDPGAHQPPGRGRRAPAGRRSRGGPPRRRRRRGAGGRDGPDTRGRGAAPAHVRGRSGLGPEQHLGRELQEDPAPVG